MNSSTDRKRRGDLHLLHTCLMLERLCAEPTQPLRRTAALRSIERRRGEAVHGRVAA
jgi:hypothetical protein